MYGKLFLISASSGAGKTSLAREIVKRMADKCSIELVVGYTSRPVQEGEVDGFDYHFIGTDEFKAKIAAGQFIEWNYGYGSYYGSPRNILDKLKRGISCVVVVGVRGVEEVVKQVPDSIPIWISTGSVEVLESRLKKRGQRSDSIEERIRVARQEIEWVKTTDLFKHKVINDIFENAVDELCNIVMCVVENKLS